MSEHLIAAAPQMAEENKRLREVNAELLAALQLCKTYLDHSLGSTSAINPYPTMNAAIAKATGGE